VHNAYTKAPSEEIYGKSVSLTIRAYLHYSLAVVAS